MEWALNSRQPTVRYRVADPRPFGMLVFGKRDVRDQVTGDWPPIPYVNEGESKTYLESLGLKGGSDDSLGESLSYPLPQQAGPGIYARLFVQPRTLKLPAETAGSHFPRGGSGLCQLRGRAVRSRPSGWLEPHAGEVRKDHAGVGNQPRKPRQ